MAPRQKHRQPVIETAVRLFRQQGYSATGLNDLVFEAGAPKGSIYHYFPEGKASIAVAAIEEAGRRVAETIAEIAARTGSTRELLIEHARLLGGWMAKSGFRDGCPITTVILELAPQERLIAVAGRKAYAARQSVLERKLMEDGFSRPKAAELAILCMSALQGSLIQARVETSRRPIDATAKQLGDLIEAARGSLDHA